MPVIDMGVISLSTEFQPCSSSNGWDMDIQKSKMAAKGSKMADMIPIWMPVIDMGVIRLSSEFQPCSSSNYWDMDI